MHPLRSVFLPLCAALLIAGCRPAEKNSPAPAARADQPGSTRHPLRGVVTDLLPERSALMVKHEEIPGVMKAMTMMFVVDATVLPDARKGAAITGMMSHRDGQWRLDEVQCPSTPRP